jgi:Methyltransferase domain
MKSVDELVEFSAKIDGQGTEDHQNCTYTKSELRALAVVLLALPMGSRITEIGVYSGRSASLYFQLQFDKEFDIALIDNWSWAAQVSAHLFVEMILTHFNENPFSLYKMPSEVMARCIPVRQNIEFLHIDGWHDMPGVEADCINWLPRVVNGGYAAFHDSDCPPVKECIDKYCAGWELVETAGRTTVWRKPRV